VVRLVSQGSITSWSGNIVLQQSLEPTGDDNWTDVAWATVTSLSPTLITLAAGGNGNAFVQRATGANPSPATGSNPCPPGARIRFVGKASLVTSSSSSSSPSGSPGKVTPAILATIKWKAVAQR
jgi:hypothetical protein